MVSELDDFVDGNAQDLDTAEELRRTTYDDVNEQMREATTTQESYERDSKDASRVFVMQSKDLMRQINKEERERDKQAKKILQNVLRLQNDVQREAQKAIQSTFKKDKDTFRDAAKKSAAGLRRAAMDFQRVYRKERSKWKKESRDVKKATT